MRPKLVVTSGDLTLDWDTLFPCLEYGQRVKTAAEHQSI